MTHNSLQISPQALYMAANAYNGIGPIIHLPARRRLPLSAGEGAYNHELNDASIRMGSFRLWSVS